MLELYRVNDRASVNETLYPQLSTELSVLNETSEKVLQ